MGMDIHRIWTWTQFFTHGFFHGRAKTVFMDMDMDLILFNPIQTRPIAILTMTSTVFGKYPHLKLFNIHYLISCRFTDACNDTGTRITHLGSDMRMKLKAAYTLIEQLYSGAQRAICTAAHNKPPPTFKKETLEKLSMLPARLDELKRSTARSGVLTALIRAKAWIPDLDSSDIGSGYPSIKEDNSEFNNDDL